MRENVKICVKTVQSEGITEFKGNAVLRKSGDSYKILYKEKIGDIEALNKLYISENKMRLVRSGEIKSDMIFIKGEKTTFDYKTNYLDQKLQIYTKSYFCLNSDDEIKLNLEYEVCACGDILNTIEMEIVVIK